MVLSAVFGKFAGSVGRSDISVFLLFTAHLRLYAALEKVGNDVTKKVHVADEHSRSVLLFLFFSFFFSFFFFFLKPNKGTWSWLFLKRIYVQNLMTRAHGLGQSLVTPLCHLISSRVKRRMGAENGRKLLPGLLDQHLYMVDLQSRRVT